MLEELKNLEKITHEKEFPMRNYTSIKVGGKARVVYYPSTVEEFIMILNTLHSKSLPFTVLGAGSNTIVMDKGINNIVLSTKKLRKLVFHDDLTVEAECGVMLSSVMNNALKRGLCGFEFAAGIPGTVGGGIYMNAGANGGEIKDVMKEVRGWKDGEVIIIKRNELKFEYRKSNLPESFVITGGVFELKEESGSDKSSENIRNYLSYRNSTQPVKIANTGSIFKNPPGISAGKLLEELGLKGYSIGGAKFSELHANFIVNLNNATADDVISLINHAKSLAMKERGIELETEVRILGEGSNK